MATKRSSEIIKSRFEYLCQLNPHVTPASVRLTGIICTIGKRSDVNELVNFMKMGMNIARLNFSFGSQGEFKETIENLHKAVDIFNSQHSKKFQFPLAIALDTKGPEIRTGSNLGDCDIELEKGDTIIISVDKTYSDKGTKDKIFIDYKELPKVVNENNEIYIDNGLICLTVQKIDNNEIYCMVEFGGILGSRKGVNLPNVKRTIDEGEGITEKDKADIKFAIDNKLDFIFASRVRSSDTIKEIKKLLGDSCIKIISKIDSKEGVDNIDSIITESFGIIISRGDLGVEIPVEKIPIVQKMIISKCNKEGKPCILSAQMLESMTYKPRATRAEISDVANAAFDNCDCAMLSGETAIGIYPIESISTMSKTLLEAESATFQRSLFEDLIMSNDVPLNATHSTAIGAVEAAMKTMATCIIVLTPDGIAAQLLSKYRPNCPIIAVTRNEVVARQMQIHRGVLSLFYKENQLEDWSEDVDKRVEFAIEFGKSLKNKLNEPIVKTGDRTVVLTSFDEFQEAQTNCMRIMLVE